MEYTLIYPNQLFLNHPGISRNRRSILIEDPLFFGDNKYPVNYHKQKLVLHHMSMRRYLSTKLQDGYEIELVNYSDLKIKNHTEWIIKRFDIKTIHIVEVNDFELRKRIEMASKNLNVSIRWYENPGFLLTQSDVISDFRGKKRHFMANFYKKQRKRFDILMDSNDNPVGGKWSYDAENRKKLPKGIHIPKTLKNEYSKNEIDRSDAFILKYFNSNPGETDGFNYPLDHNQAVKSLDHFLTDKFELFGPYEDAISQIDSTLFHSVITPYLNIGLITPIEVINRIIDYAEHHNIPINSYEGLIRQIIGWREFIRGIYVEDGVKQRTTNFWKFDRSMPSSFYDGTTGIPPIDVTIKKLLKNAYLHHIERLMIMGNFLFLLKINPNHVYRWFMELHIDAYDWVMVPNVYGMSQFSDGGLMSTKPYISGSNYILKMSDYKKGDWCGIWDALYWNFINENRDFFRKNPRTSMMINMYDKKSKEIKNNYLKIEKDLQL
tara:strand:+ start:322 stop:1797 length:1476 start_codon:yes stop_codon:yes gene_type:complete